VFIDTINNSHRKSKMITWSWTWTHHCDTDVLAASIWHDLN